MIKVMLFNNILLLLALVLFYSTVSLQQHFQRSTLTEKYDSIDFESKTAFKSVKTSNAVIPGSKAQKFQVWTLYHGLVTYPSALLPENIPIGFHAFTNESGFLECMWTNDKSLLDFVNSSPSNIRYVFMSFDTNAKEVVLWMQKRLSHALTHSNLKEKDQEAFLGQCYFVVTPVFEIGNWIATILSDWSCVDHGCGLNQLVFSSPSFYQTPPIMVSKRVDARYDWVFNHSLSPNNLRVNLSLNSCDSLSDEFKDLVGLILYDSSKCSIAKQVYNLQTAGAAGVLIYSKPGYPLQDLNCEGSDCNNMIKIPVANMPYNSVLLEVLSSGGIVNVSQQTTPYSNFYFTINGRGELVEAGWFLYPSMQFMAWQMQWLVFDDNLVHQISQLDDYVVPIFNRTVMQGKNGTGSVSLTFTGLSSYTELYIDAALGCESDTDAGCPPWDHVPQLFLCCEGASLCDVEIGRWITAFRRGIGHWLTDISPLLPLFAPSKSTSKCSFTMKMSAWWAKPWVPAVILRFQKPKLPELIAFNQHEVISLMKNTRPSEVIPLFKGGTFDHTYNSKYDPIQFELPPDVQKVVVYAVITGHGSDNNGCGEFCITSHTFVINGQHKHVKTFSNAGTPLGCAERVPEGVVPNEHGTWLYGRDGWCDGQQVDPWIIDVTSEVTLQSQNNVTYFGLFNGKDPNPTQNPGSINMVSYLVYYRAF